MMSMLFTTLVVSFLVCCKGQLGWSGVRVVGSSTTAVMLEPATKNNTTNVVNNINSIVACS